MQRTLWQRSLNRLLNQLGRSRRPRRSRPELESLEVRLAPAVFAGDDTYVLTAGTALTVPGGQRVVAQSGFNDAAGIHSDALPNSPYQFGTTIAGRGGPEAGWATGWFVSDGGAIGGEGRALATASPVYEGDGSVHVRGPGSLGNMWLHRQWAEPQFDRFVLEQRIRLPANGIIGSRPYGVGSGFGAFGPVWTANNNRFFAHDGDTLGSATPEATGFAVTPLAWHKVSLVIDMAAQTYEFFVDGQKYVSPDPLNFRGRPWSLANVDYLIDSDAWLDEVRISSLDRTRPVGVAGNDLTGGEGPLTVRLVRGPDSGTLTLNDDGGFTYTPVPGFTGSVTFTYVAGDGEDESGEATVTLTINPPAPVPIAVADHYTVPRDGVLVVGGGGTSQTVAQSGLNDASGINSNALPGSPYQFGVTVHGRGGPESGWASGWVVSDGGCACGEDRGKAVANPFHEGDGSLHIRGPGSLGNAWVHRQWTEPQFARFILEQRVRFPAYGILGSRPYGPGGHGPVWSVSGNRFFAHDGDTFGGGVPEDTGFTVTPLAWHKITLIVNVASQTYEFYVDDQHYLAPDPLNFRERPTSIYSADYLADTDIWIDSFRMIALGPTINGVLVNDSSPSGAPLTAHVVTGPARGTLTHNSNGGFRYVPNPGFTGTDTFTYQASDGSYTSAVTTVTIGVGLPTISPIADQTTTRDTPVGPLGFTVSDVETPAVLLTVSAASSNPLLAPSAALLLGGSGTDRTLTITPASGRTGSAFITVTVRDADGGTASTRFLLVVGPGGILITGADVTGKPHVRVFDSLTLTERYSFYAFGTDFLGGVRVAAGDVTGDRVPDILAATGPGIEAELRIFDGASPSPFPTLVARLNPYPGFSGGLFVAAADFTRDGRADLIVAPDQGVLPGTSIAPPLLLLDAATSVVLGAGWPYGPEFSGGVRLATGDVNGDGVTDLITVPGPGSKAQVQVLSGMGGGLISAFLAFDSAYTGGAFVAAGDVNADGRADLVVGAGDGLGARVRLFDSSAFGVAPPALTEFAAYPGFTGPVRVAILDINRDGRPDLLTGPGGGSEPRAKAFSAATGEEFGSALVYDPAFLGGFFLGAGTA